MNLADLTTEGRNPNSTDLDRLSAVEIVRLMNREDHGVPEAIAAVEEPIAAAIEIITDRLRQGGRLIYMGAGTSGRLGVLDAAECPPTFNSPPWQVVGLIAGGPAALTRAIEGAEDHEQLGIDDLRKIDCSQADVVVGIATSGRTPYVLGGLKHARSVGAKAIGLSCNTDSGLHALCDIEIAPIVGPEVVTGSTRLKAGTATKLVLNMLTTGAMVRLGKTYGNLMVDLQATNQKLTDRSERLVAELAGVTRAQADKLLVQCDGDVKTAIIAHKQHVPARQARQQLQIANGRLRDALEADPTKLTLQSEDSGLNLVLGVDGGGTKTLCGIAPLDSTVTEPIATGQSGTSNPQAVGWAAAQANIDLAISRAFADARRPRHSVAAATLAIAGTGSDADQQRLRTWTRQQRIAEHVLTTHDAQPILAQGTSRGVGVALISGTGSFAFGQNASGETARAGGWGHALGDDGGGYGMALAGLRAVAGSHDQTGPPTSLTDALCQHLELQSTEGLRRFLATNGTDVSTMASLAPIVLVEAEAGDPVARQIVEAAAAQLALLVQSVASRLFGPDGQWELALAGGLLMHSATLRERLLQELAKRGGHFTQAETVEEPVRGALRMARELAASKSKQPLPET